MDEGIRDTFKGKVILVTGGTGTIGSEITKQLLLCNPKTVRIFSRDETRQYQFMEELGLYFNDIPKSNLRFLIGDIRDRARLKRAMEGVEYVFHAAALKHVPICEYNPFEAVSTNVIGTQNVIEAGLDANVKKIVVVSTDKAVDPQNTMGATKLLAEHIAVGASQYIAKTKIVTVRFGNILGSRGSVLPLVKEQIKKGGPVTLTHPEMRRFMMSIREAVNLLLKASTIDCSGGEIYILKMNALKIIDLLEVVIQEYAPKCSQNPENIKLQEIGIRPGEKLDEKLLNENELTRVVLLDKMLVVHPYYRKITPSIIPEELYISSKARLLSRNEIKEILYKENLI